MKKSYLESALKAHEAGQDAEKILQKGIAEISNCLNGLLLDFNSKDCPLIVAILEISAEALKKVMSPKEKILVEKIKGSISTEVTSVDVEEIEKQVKDLKNDGGTTE